MSFIDMYSNDIWTDVDITNRTEAMVRAVIPLQDELVLNRKIQGANLGEYTLTEKDQSDILKLKEIGFLAQLEGIAARNDMALLLKVLEYEKAKRRLDVPVIKAVTDEDGNIINQNEIDLDLTERSTLTPIIDNANEAVINWYNLRNPVIEEEITEEQSN